MPQTAVEYPTLRQQLGRPRPRDFGQRSWWRFCQDRRTSLIRRCGGQPSDRQAFIIDEMVNAEWTALKLEFEAEGEVRRDRNDFCALRLMLVAGCCC